MVHLSYPYMITEKTTALTTADGKQISVHGPQEGMYKWYMRVGLLPLRENWLSIVKHGGPGEGFHWEHRTYTLVCGKSPPSARLQLGLCSLGAVSFLSFRSVAELPAPSYSPAIRVDV